jgi:menaquinone-dependent protoporphyrinogen oxidase
MTPIRSARRTDIGPALIVYATREGQTRRIAERMAVSLEARGRPVELLDASAASGNLNFDLYAGVVLMGSVHAGRHEPELIAFAKKHRQALGPVPTAFLSVSLSEAGAENARATPEQRAQDRTKAERQVQTFVDESGLLPDHVQPIAGALAYTKYPRFLRLIVRWIAKRAGLPADASRDYDFTNYAELDRFTDRLEAEWAGGARSDHLLTRAGRQLRERCAECSPSRDPDTWSRA